MQSVSSISYDDNHYTTNILYNYYQNNVRTEFKEFIIKLDSIFWTPK